MNHTRISVLSQIELLAAISRATKDNWIRLTLTLDCDLREIAHDLLAFACKSNHRVLSHGDAQDVLNVFDIGPLSIKPANKKDAFIEKLKAEPRIGHLILPPKDPGIHVEILQMGRSLMNDCVKGDASSMV